MEGPELQNRDAFKTGQLYSEAVHVSYMPPHRHLKTGPFRPLTYKAHSVSLKKTGMSQSPWKNQYPFQNLSTNTYSGGFRKKHPGRPTFTPCTTCAANLYRCIIRRLVCSLRRLYSQRSVVHTKKQTPHQVSGTEGCSPGPEMLQATLQKPQTTPRLLFTKKGYETRKGA